MNYLCHAGDGDGEKTYCETGSKTIGFWRWLESILQGTWSKIFQYVSMGDLNDTSLRISEYDSISFDIK